MSDNTQPIKINEKASKQVREFLDASQRIQEQVNAAVRGMAAALDVPDDWQFDARMMAFVPPAPTAPPAPETAEPEAEPEAEQPQAEDA